MIEFRKAKIEDKKEIATFIAKMNGNEENHIGFCGVNSEEIEHSLIKDITDIPLTDSFIIAHDGNKTLGVLGFDTDLDSNNAEIWGPFIENSKWNFVADMWNRMVELLPNDIETLSMFINKKNTKCIKLAHELQFSSGSEQTILKFERNMIYKLQDLPLVELSTNFYEDMKCLHDKVFPNTYYSGRDIIERINDHRKVFIEQENNYLLGYIYCEVSPQFGEGSIEFFAVDKSKRGKGIGSRLLTMALKWLFSFMTVNEIILCVNAENEQALKLYKGVGFEDKYQLLFLKKSI